jgi:diguanylate cyclase (GGDEF)-like protein
MPNIIDSVADLTDLRDMDDLEITFAKMAFEFVGASSLILWRLVSLEGEMWLRERTRLPLIQSACAAQPSADIALANARTELRACYETRRYLSQPPNENGMWGNVFPVYDGRNVICLFEILLPAPLRVEQERMVYGLLRILRNHVGILDYSDHDELTGLLNRRTFDESFKRVVLPKRTANDARDMPSAEQRKQNVEPALAHLAVVDIDFFKRINDQFGHPYGDEVLVLLGQLMGLCFRETDRLFRFGGEEFLVILPDTDLQQAALALERFRAAIEAFKFSQVGQVTVSIGFTAVVTGDTGSTAFGRADEALYVAKHQGRNRVKCYELLVAEGALAPRAANDQEIELF